MSLPLMHDRAVLLHRMLALPVVIEIESAAVDDQILAPTLKLSSLPTLVVRPPVTVRDSSLLIDIDALPATLVVWSAPTLIDRAAATFVVWAAPIVFD